MDNKYFPLISQFINNKSLVRQHIESYNYFIEQEISNIIKANSIIDSDVDPNFYVKYLNVSVQKPKALLNDGSSVYKKITPFECRLRDDSYLGGVYVNIEYTKGKQVCRANNVLLCRLPVMLRSSMCYLSGDGDKENVSKRSVKKQSNPINDKKMINNVSTKDRNIRDDRNIVNDENTKHENDQIKLTNAKSKNINKTSNITNDNNTNEQTKPTNNNTNNNINHTNLTLTNNKLTNSGNEKKDTARKGLLNTLPAKGSTSRAQRMFPLIEGTPTTNNRFYSQDECPLDTGGYFIVKGVERVVLIQEQLSKNRIIVENIKNTIYASVTSSTNEKKSKTIVYCSEKTGELFVKFNSFIEDIPLVVVVKALGIHSDLRILNLIGNAYEHLIEPSLEAATKAGVFDSRSALTFIGDRLRVRVPGAKAEEARVVVTEVLLPNVEGVGVDTRPKGLFLCVMARRVLQAISKRCEHLSLDEPCFDDRDFTGNKRFELAGTLLALLFEDQLKRYNTELKKTIDRALLRRHAAQAFDVLQPMALQASLITTSFIRAISTGNWVVKRFRMERAGVTQVLSRLSYISALGMMGRINSQFERTRKVSGPRALHTSQFGYICPADTPEGESCGLVKNLALMAEITTDTDFVAIKRVVYSLGVRDIALFSDDLYVKNRFMVFLNGSIVGTIDCADRFIAAFRRLRREGKIHKFVSIYKNTTLQNINISCDGGRITRPLIVVKKYTINGNSNNEECEGRLECERRVECERIEDEKRKEYDKYDNKEDYKGGKRMDDCSYNKDVNRFTDKQQNHLLNTTSDNASLNNYSIHTSSNTTSSLNNTFPLNSSLETLLPLINNVTIQFLQKQYFHLIKHIPLHLETNTSTSTTNHVIFLPSVTDLDISYITQNLKDFDSLIQEGKLEYLDCNESGDSLLSMYPNNITNNTTHLEIEPFTILGTVSSLIPFPDHNQSPRNTYQCAMGKQAMGYFALNMYKRFDTLIYILTYSHKPLCKSLVVDLVNFEKLPAGINSMVAVMSYSGYDIEDALVLNKSSLDRGFGRCEVYKNFTVAMKKYLDGSSDRIVRNLSVCGDKAVFDATDIHTDRSLVYKIVDISNKQRVKELTVSNNVKERQINEKDRINNVHKRSTEREGFKEHNMDYNSKIKEELKEHNMDYNSKVKEGLKEDNIYLNSNITSHFSDTHDLDSNDKELNSKISNNLHINLYDDDSNNVSNDISNFNHNTYDIHSSNKNNNTDHFTNNIYDIHSNNRSNNTFNFNNSHATNNKSYIHFSPSIQEINALNLIKPKFKKKNTQQNIQNFIQFKHSSLDNDGIAAPGATLKEGQIFINLESPNNKIYKFAGQTYKNKILPSIVDKVLLTKNNDDNLIIKTLLKQIRRPEIGDKFSSRHGQKGVVGIIVNQENMPFSENGVCPDIIMNPHGFPSRMTVGKILELVCGKAGLLLGKQVYTTPFIQFSNDFLGEKKELERMRDSNGQLVLNKLNSLRSKYQSETGTQPRLEGDNSNIRISKENNSNTKINENTISKENKSNIRISKENKSNLSSNENTISKENNMNSRLNSNTIFDENSINTLSKNSNTRSNVSTRFNENNLNTNSLINAQQKINNLQNNPISTKNTQPNYSDEPVDIEFINKTLITHGFSYTGKDIFYSGTTGKLMSAYIYFGPIYYQKLKHMVADKMHARSTGPKTALTRQPTEGRARDGGLRLGEMERDCLIGYGASNLLVERLLVSSDSYQSWVCRSCGVIGYRNFCKMCGKSDVADVKLPYACKLLFQELMGMNILPKIILKK